MLNQEKRKDCHQMVGWDKIVSGGQREEVCDQVFWENKPKAFLVKTSLMVTIGLFAGKNLANLYEAHRWCQDCGPLGENVHILLWVWMTGCSEHLYEKVSKSGVGQSQAHHLVIYLFF